MRYKKMTFLLAAFLIAGVAKAQTIYTGDKIQGFPVISQLDIKDLEKGKTHRFLFQGVEMGSGQRWYIPVMVAKGIHDGKKLLLIAGVHGDEVSPVAVVQRSMAAIDPKKLSGSVMAVFDVSRASVETIQRKWPISESGGQLVDMNRVWPGIEFGNAPERQAWLVWNNLFKNNTDLALDFHTGSTGQDFALFIFANNEKPENTKLAELFPVDQIKDDPGGTGILETAFFKANIPAITIEVGGPRQFDNRMIQAGIEGIKNVMAAYKMINSPVGKTAKDVPAYVGNNMEEIHAKTGGYVDMLVDLNDTVSAGQKVAVQRNFFGDIVYEYKTGISGRVSIIARDAHREPGTHLITIMTKKEKRNHSDYISSEIGQ